MARLMNKLQEIWCRVMHPDPMWPVKGVYRCPTCLREYPVAWEQGIREAETAATAAQPVMVGAKTATARLTLVRRFGRQAA